MSTISVIIPTYNCGAFITKAIDDALGQTIAPHEIVVVDDGSTDDTHEILKPYLEKDIVIYIRQENQGAPVARNTGIMAATGDYIAYVDADDELDPTNFEKCLTSLEANGADWCFTNLVRVRHTDDGIFREHARIQVPLHDVFHGILREDYIFTNPFIKRQVLLDVGMYDARLKTREDWDLNIKLIENKYPFCHIDEPLYFYNIRGTSLMRGRKRLINDCTLQVLRKHHKRIADGGDREAAVIYAECLWWLAKSYLTDSHAIAPFLSCVKESLTYDFNMKRLLNPLFSRLGITSGASN